MVVTWREEVLNLAAELFSLDQLHSKRAPSAHLYNIVNKDV